MFFADYLIFSWQGNEDLIIVHDALEYGDCRLSLAVSNDELFIIPKHANSEYVELYVIYVRISADSKVWNFREYKLIEGASRNATLDT